MSEPTSAEQDRLELELLLRGFEVSRILRLVADLGIADQVPPEASTPVSELAGACSVLPEPLIRVLRALAALRIFQVSADGRVAHTPRSRLLRTDTPNSLHHAARFWAAPGSWNAWGMLDVALTGGTPHHAAWNTDRFTYLRRHPDEARLFDALMANYPDNRHAAIAAAYDFSQARALADLGGGNGAGLRHILTRFPEPRGLVFDLEDVVAAMKPDDFMEGRIRGEVGNFFDRVPTGADIYLLIWVLHDWSDDDCLRILRTCRAAMAKDAVLLLGEEILELDPARGRALGYLIDLHMMAIYDRARARSEAEFRSLLDRAGFALRRIIPTGSAVSLIEASPSALDAAL